MTAPLLRAAMAGAMAPVSRNVAVTLTASAAVMTASPTSAVGFGVMSIAALLTRMSGTPPTAARAASASACTAGAPAARSAGTNVARPPAAPITRVTSAPRPASRPLTTTWAPAAASSAAIAAPMPSVEPVTSALRPASEVVVDIRGFLPAMVCMTAGGSWGVRWCAPNLLVRGPICPG